MTVEHLRAALRAIKARQDAAPDGSPSDLERDHVEADAALIAFIGDKTVAEVFDAIEKWYA